MWNIMSKIALIWLNASILLRERTIVWNYLFLFIHVFNIQNLVNIMPYALLFFMYTRWFNSSSFFHRAEYLELSADKIYTNDDGQ